MIRQIVDRLHVSASARDVIRAVRKALHPDARGREYRATRHKALREALEVHKGNRELYRAVMRGM